MDSFEELDDHFGTYSRADYFHDIELAALYIKMPSRVHTWPSRQFTKLFEGKTQAMDMSLFEFS